ncbi:hypothetical protein AYJ05_01795 [Corynebacterium stationis]|uniref:Uncharacterized protein n=1 Tax=Corynebacterium stationis TaxID=1705 RepID=A0A177IVY1_9CORY|nr:hypothetical protein AYJ05_01795 [Corynebacterium stationis]
MAIARAVSGFEVEVVLRILQAMLRNGGIFRCEGFMDVLLGRIWADNGVFSPLRPVNLIKGGGGSGGLASDVTFKSL